MRKTQVPIPKTVSDCILLHQMGYSVEVNDGDTITVKRRNRVLTREYIKKISPYKGTQKYLNFILSLMG